jgi:nucleoside-diphosphate-sugar epimerase
MKILLTGAAGFLGQRTRSLLEQRGHVVMATDRVGNFPSTGDLAQSAFTESLPDADVVIHAAAVQYVSNDLPF